MPRICVYIDNYGVQMYFWLMAIHVENNVHHIEENCGAHMIRGGPSTETPTQIVNTIHNNK